LGQSAARGGGAPRQGWLNSFDGVFYRLGVGTYGYGHNFLDNGHQNSGLLQLYLPLDQRFEFRLDFPVVSNRGATGTDYETNFDPDFRWIASNPFSSTSLGSRALRDIINHVISPVHPV